MTKAGEDKAPSLAALLAYYGLLSVFPLLLVLITLLGLIFGHDPGVRADLEHSALAQFPIVGKRLTSVSGFASLRERGVVGLSVGFVGLAWGSLGVTRAGQRAMADVWNIPQWERPRLGQKLARGVSFLGVLVLDVIVTTIIAGVVTWGHHDAWLEVVAVVTQLLLNVTLFILGFRALTPPVVPTRDLLVGATVAAFGWSVLEYLGTWLVSHELRHASELYGYFASVLGLISYLYVAAAVTVIAAEINVVRARGLYPRSLSRDTMTVADRTVWRDLTLQSQRRATQVVRVEFDENRRAEPD